MLKTGSLLGMYVHTHWSYHPPYAARTWTLDQWKDYLRALSRIGYSMVQIWPMLDTMPVPPTPSDEEHLEKLRQVIRFARDELSMIVYVGICPNTSPNEKAASFTFPDRKYFECEALVNPSDRDAMDREMDRRRAVLAPLAEADGVWILDCDPGGYPGSPVSDFVDILARHRKLLNEIRSEIRLIYWMWAGWQDKHRFTIEMKNTVQSCWAEALEGLRTLNPEPWAVHCCWPGHFKAVKRFGLEDRVHFYPYNMIEAEPSYPITNWDTERLNRTFDWVRDYSYPMGCLGNSQTHCVQFPHAYVFAHLARGGTLETLDVAGFGERLLPGNGETLANAWESFSMEWKDGSKAREAAKNVSELLRQDTLQTGELEGFFFGSPKRYLEDLKLQLELWANLVDMKGIGGSAPESEDLRRAALRPLHDWSRRHGFHWEKGVTRFQEDLEAEELTHFYEDIVRRRTIEM